MATALMNMGLVHITASVYQMLRGAELVFAAIFSIVFLKRKLNYMHLNGLLLRCACACVATAVCLPYRSHILAVSIMRCSLLSVVRCSLQCARCCLRGRLVTSERRRSQRRREYASFTPTLPLVAT